MFLSAVRPVVLSPRSKFSLLISIARVQQVHYFSVISGKRQITNHCQISISKMKDTTKILSDLRKLMSKLPNNGGSISAYIIPSDDAHQNEYIGDHDARRRFVSGFAGSLGTAVITQKDALMWTDGRYYQQATKEMDNNWTLMKEGLSTTPTIGVWLSENLANGDVVGVDPNIISCLVWNPLATALDDSGKSLRTIETNLIDLIWTEQPPAASNSIITLSTEITGKMAGDKISDIRKVMTEKRADVLVVTALDEIAWLLNMRGTDIPYNPIFFAYVIVTQKNIHFFVDSSKLPPTYEQHFQDNNIQVTVEPYNQITNVLKELINGSTSKVWINWQSSYALTSLVPEKRRLQEMSPISLMKAIKNGTEANGMRNCHIRDGVALCQYFAWLEKELQAGTYVDEISGATRLEEFRRKQDKFMGLSFSTISASGPNGSIIHYHPEESSNRQITLSEIYLCDSGAQYMDGTTDVTRTWHFGTPTQFQIECNTRVLKGQISLGTAVFPNKIKGQMLDTLARKALWDVGLDYAHGTGHGIGHFLNVHEGPMGISFRVHPDDSGLQANMFVSNEPGFYKEGEFGIRIEDIVQVVPANLKNDFVGRGALTFYTVTMCPIQTKLIDSSLLTEQQISHLNYYHKSVFDTLSPLLLNIGDSDTVDWLKKETLPI